jgi:hypothetical protein
MRATHRGAASLVVVLSALLGVQAGAATSPPPPSQLVEYSCDLGRPHLVVWRDANATLTTAGPADALISRGFQVGPDRFLRLWEALDRARFHTLRRVYRPRNPHPLLVPRCAISYEGRTVAMQGGTLPQRLRNVVRILDAIVRANARRR